MQTMIYGIINFFSYLIHWSELSVQASISPRGWGGREAFSLTHPAEGCFFCALL